MVYKGTVCDVKSTSTWKFILGDGDDYVKQMVSINGLTQIDYVK